MIRIYTFTSGPASFLPHQAALFDAFLDDDFELVVVNDGQEQSASAEIERVAAGLELRSERVPLPPCNDPSVGLGRAMEYALTELACQDELVLFIHGDVFPCRPFSARTLMDGADLIAYPELKVSDDRTVRLYYPWSGVIGLRVAALRDVETIGFGPGEIQGIRVDTGGMFQLYHEAHPQLRLRALARRPIVPGEHEELLPGASRVLVEGRGVELIAEVFLHYLSFSGWFGEDPSARSAKQVAAFAFFERLADGSIRLPACEASIPGPWPVS